MKARSEHPGKRRRGSGTAFVRSLLLPVLPFLPACQGSEAGPPLVVQRDSAGIEIVEAMRPLWGDSSLWSIDPDPLVDLTLSGNGPHHEFHGLRDMKQRPDGSLMVADGSSNEVRVFSAAGEFLGSFGGRGDGPGEFRTLRRIESAGDTLLALDRGRLTVAAHDLTVVGTFDIDPWTVDLHYVDGGRILPEISRPVLPMDGLTGSVRPPQPLVLLDLKGARIDSVGELRGAEVHVLVRDGSYVGTAPHFFGKASHVAALGGHILRGSSDAMRLEELDLSGNLVRILRIPGYPLDLSDALIAAERDFLLDGFTPGHPLRAPFEAAPVSDTRPAFTDILVDSSGAVWLELHRGRTEQDQPEKWLVLDADGTWLGTVEMPDRFRVAQITMDAVLGVREDALDIQHPQLLRLTRN
ncbi:MAG: hypothetical protein F4X22_15365 [Gemmatimonadales bacterium]|nr:hypothetical protein [Candidatus Palauibacter denitrificans]